MRKPGRKSRRQPKTSNIVCGIDMADCEGLARSTARSYSWAVGLGGICLDDLVMAAFSGIHRAAEKWRPGAARFASYGRRWARSNVRRFIQCNAAAVHVPVHVQRGGFRMASVCSLDAPTRSNAAEREAPLTLLDRLHESDSDPYVDRMLELMAQLSRQERAVIQARRLLRMTWDGVASHVGTKPRASRRLEALGMAKLSWLAGSTLRAVLDQSRDRPLTHSEWLELESWVFDRIRLTATKT